MFDGYCEAIPSQVCNPWLRRSQNELPDSLFDGLRQNLSKRRLAMNRHYVRQTRRTGPYRLTIGPYHLTISMRPRYRVLLHMSSAVTGAMDPDRTRCVDCEAISSPSFTGPGCGSGSGLCCAFTIDLFGCSCDAKSMQTRFSTMHVTARLVLSYYVICAVGRDVIRVLTMMIT